ncbi:MAG TPA: hypothetical protein VI585_22380 [Candidatus Binatia bacterium]
MQTEEDRRLKEISRTDVGAGVEIQIVARRCDDQHVAGVFAENTKIPFHYRGTLVVFYAEK